MTQRNVPALAGVLVGTVAVAMSTLGCSSDDSTTTSSTAPPVVQLGAPGEPNQILTDDQIAALPIVEYSQSDVDFVHGMIAHHEQALVMSALIDDRSTNDQLALFAERLDISQTDEIALMEKWLDDRDENLPDDSAGHMDHMGPMPGMLSDAQLTQLEQATGTDFDRAFLQFMIQHHQGALVMVDDLFNSDDGGLEPSIFNLASHIVGDQEIEISRMTAMLTELDA